MVDVKSRFTSHVNNLTKKTTSDFEASTEIYLKFQVAEETLSYICVPKLLYYILADYYKGSPCSE